LLPKLKGKTVLWHTDSKNCVSIIGKGCTNACLNEFALEIFNVCAKNAIILRVVWLSRDKNTIADSLSKMINYDDYRVKQEFFDYVDALFGPHDVDRFANEVNHILPRYNSLAWTPSTEAVDAFSVSWKNYNNWLVPPVNLIPKASNHLVACKGQGLWFLVKTFLFVHMFQRICGSIALMTFMFKAETHNLFLALISSPVMLLL